jgi:hypothetical protein
MKDKHGSEFKDVVAIQEGHLKMWSTKLVTFVYQEVSDYVRKHNLPATDDTKSHQVFRGQDLVQIIMDWPDLKPCYPSPVATEDVI